MISFRTILVTATCLLLSTGAAWPQASIGPASPIQDHVEGEILVRFIVGSDSEALESSVTGQWIDGRPIRSITGPCV